MSAAEQPSDGEHPNAWAQAVADRLDDGIPLIGWAEIRAENRADCLEGTGSK